MRINKATQGPVVTAPTNVPMTKGQAAIGVGEVAAACLSGVFSALPPSFCERQDQSQPQLICPSGYYLGFSSSVVTCIQNCTSAYPNLIMGYCYANCPSGLSYDILFPSHCGRNIAHGGFANMATRGWMTPKLIQINSSSVTCPSGFIKYVLMQGSPNGTDSPWAITCIRNCNAQLGLQNCQQKYCSSTPGQCTGGILSMDINIIISVAEAIIDIVSLGTAAVEVATAKASLESAAESLGNDALQASFSSLKALFLSPNVVTQLATTATNTAKTILKNSALNVVDSYVSGVCYGLTQQIAANITSSSVAQPANTNFFNFLNIASVVSGCGASGNTGSCTSAVLGTIGQFDPTGIFSVAAAFIQPTCSGV